jgi:heme-degrading monooxygenase HmoA
MGRERGSTMAYVLIQHKIGQWGEFENIFRGDGERRRALGSKGGKVFANVRDPENVFVVFEWKDIEGAKTFADGLETHEAMKWATSGMWSRVYVVEERFEVDA